MSWLRETIYPDFAQMLRYDELLHRRTSPHQTIEVFQTRRLGRVLVLDGAIQLTEADNHIYHEMLVHVPLLSHGCASSVLIVGGGDGATLREVLKHPVQEVTLVEIDPQVTEVSKQYFPELARGAFYDPRARVVFEDAAGYVQRCNQTFDVIIIDSTDPAGPGGVLFTAGFYTECRRLLRKDAAIVLQAGAPVTCDPAARIAADEFEAVFGAAEEYIATVPSYPMGMVVVRGKARGGWRLSGDRATLERRFRQLDLKTCHYTPSVHVAAFDVFPRVSRRRCERIADAAIQPKPEHQVAGDNIRAEGLRGDSGSHGGIRALGEGR